MSCKKITLEHIKKWLIINNRQFRLLENQIYTNNSTKLKFYCFKCNNIFVCSWANILRNNKCGICNGKQISIGYNDIATTRPDLVKHFKNEEDCKLYTKGSYKKVMTKCPNCDYEKIMTINKLSIRGFSCPRCSDGVSTPNKFIFGLLKELNLDFKPEYKIDKYRYDFFLPDMNITIEAHGIQHYENSGLGKRTIEEEQQNDINKRVLSESLGNIHIEIDCRKSDYGFIKEQCIRSLSSYIDLSNIDWMKVYEYCSNSLMIKACELWNNNYKIIDIADILKINRTTVLTYLKKGNTLNMCNYDGNTESDNHIKNNQKRVIQYSKENILIKEYESIVLASDENKINDTQISLCCKGKYKTAGGFIWKYKEL